MTTCLPKFRTFDCCVTAIISFVSENRLSLSSATQILKADGYFPSAFVRIILIDKLEFENELIGELSATLDEIEVQNNEIPPRVEYTATERAKTLRTFFEAMAAWGRQYGYYIIQK